MMVAEGKDSQAVHADGEEDKAPPCRLDMMAEEGAPCDPYDAAGDDTCMALDTCMQEALFSSFYRSCSLSCPASCCLPVIRHNLSHPRHQLHLLNEPQTEACSKHLMYHLLRLLH
jgi:hypothetical protein